MSPLSFGFAKTLYNTGTVDLAVQYGRYFVFEYQFTDGLDLDTRTGFVYPEIGAGNPLTQYEGYGRDGNEFLNWGGDNTGTGYESCYIDKEQVFTSYPGTTYIEIDLRAYWYVPTRVGTNPVTVKTNAYTGGTMVKDSSGYLWVNPTATYSFPGLSSVSSIITQVGDDTNLNGQRIAKVKIDFTNFTITYS